MRIYDSRRMDRERKPEESMPAIQKGIRSSAFVVADLSGGSANVLYEIGYADALKKRVLLITRDDDSQVPFSTRTRQYLKYKPDALTCLVDDIQKWVGEWQKKGIVPYKLD